MVFIYATSLPNIHLNSSFPACCEVLKYNFVYLMIPQSWENWSTVCPQAYLGHELVTAETKSKHNRKGKRYGFYQWYTG